MYAFYEFNFSVQRGITPIGSKYYCYFSAVLELNEDPEVARAKYFIRDEFLVNIADKIRRLSFLHSSITKLN